MEAMNPPGVLPWHARKDGSTVPPLRPPRAAAFFVGFFAGFWTPPAPVALRFEATAFIGGGGICAPPLCANGRGGTKRTRAELPAAATAAPLGFGTGCGGTRTSGAGTV